MPSFVCPEVLRVLESVQLRTQPAGSWSPAQRPGFPRAGQEPHSQPSLAQALLSTFPETSRYEGNLRRPPVLSEEKCMPGPSKQQSFPGRRPCAWQLRAVSPPHFPAHITAESRRNWEWLSAKSCRRTANPVLEGGTGSKPFNGLSPMIISPGLELANGEPL